MYALRVLRAHGLHDGAVQNIYRSVVLAKLLYASSSWTGFSNATDRQKLQDFSTGANRSGFRDSEIDDFATLCSTADKQLFIRILNQPEHVLHSLLPPPSASQYNLCDRPHNRLLCQRASRLTVILSLECYIAICIDWYYVHFTALCLFHMLKCVFDISLIKELIDWLIELTT